MQSAEVPDGPLTSTTVDALLDRLNAGTSGGVTVGDRFLITGEPFEEDAWGVGATGDYSVYLEAKGGRDDLLVLVVRTSTTGRRNGTRVERVVKAMKKTINGETTDGWLQAQSVKLLQPPTVLASRCPPFSRGTRERQACPGLQELCQPASPVATQPS